MGDEHTNNSTLTPPLCPNCAQRMKLVRKTTRFGGLPDLYTFECRTCGISHTEASSWASLGTGMAAGTDNTGS
jgi:C4-type Zn-finger protein